MKNKAIWILVGLLGLCSEGLAEDWKVTTEIGKKNILMEEFTGTSCYWCPEGHAVAERMAHVWPGRVYIVNIHTGSLARGYTTDAGDAIGKYFNTEEAGYPCGDVNRHDAGYGLVMSRNLWQDAASYELEEDAPVNLLLESSYDSESRELKVHAEGYFTGPVDGEQRLNVMLLQNNVWGFQNGATGGDYCHLHMFRQTLTDVWGEVISEAGEGQYFERNYSLTLPEKIVDVEVKPVDLELVAFVSKGETDVQQVTGCRPTGLDVPFSIALAEPRIYIGTQYGYRFFEVLLENKCDEPITTASFEVTVGQKTETITQDCNIGAYGFEYISQPMEYSYSQRGTTKYSISLTAANGKEVERQTISGQFVKPYVTTQEVQVTLQMDERASQNTFAIRDELGNVVKELGPYTDGEAQLVEEKIALEAGKTYCLEVSDAWGDGLLSGVEGYYELRNADGILIEKKNVYGYGQRTFFTTEASEGIESLKNDAAQSIARYDLWGRAWNEGAPEYSIEVLRQGNEVIKKVNIK